MPAHGLFYSCIYIWQAIPIREGRETIRAYHGVDLGLRFLGHVGIEQHGKRECLDSRDRLRKAVNRGLELERCYL